MAVLASSLSARDAFAKILSPRSVVVVGGSERPGTMPAAAIQNLRRHGFGGTVYVVNPNRERVFEHKAYPSVAALPEVPDAAIIVVGAARAAEAVAECAAHGVGVATVVAAGFGEGAARGHGRDHTAELERVVGETGIRLLGPNTTGVLNVLDGYVPRAAMNHPPQLIGGNVAIVGQSGAVGNAVLNRALRHNVGVGYLVATGNQMDLDVWDAADYALADPRIQVLLLIIESLGRPDKMRAVAAAARRAGKPIVALKLGTSARGSAVVSNHSGALAGSAELQAAVLDDEGIVRVHELDELWETAALFQSWGVPSTRANHIGVVCTSGGEAALAADTADGLGLVLPDPSPATVDRLTREFSFASPSNPFDTTAEFLGQPNLFRTGVEAMLSDERFAATVLSVSIPAGMFGSARQDDLLAAVANVPGARLLLALRSTVDDTPRQVSRLLENGIPVFEGVERALRAVAHYDRYPLLAARIEARQSRAELPNARVAPLEPPRSYWRDRVALADAGVPFNPARLVGVPAQAVAAAHEVGLPVVLKLSTAGSGHKLKAGGVRLLLSTDADIERAATELLDGAEVDLDLGLGLVVERQVAGLAEVFIGAHRDPELGAFLVCGWGGSWTEALRDVTHIPLPAAVEDIGERFGRTRLGEALAQRGVGLTAIAEAAYRAGVWFQRHPEVVSLDLNPILVLASGGVVAVDARVALGTQ